MDYSEVANSRQQCRTVNQWPSALYSTTMNTDTALTITKYEGLELVSQTALELAFSPFYLDAQKWMKMAREINVTDVSQKREMFLARQYRLGLKAVRLQLLDEHKAAKSDVLIKGRAIDAEKNKFLGVVQPMEEHLLAQEQFAERIEAARVEAEQAALRQSRNAELLALGFPYAGPDLGSLNDGAYLNILADAKAIKAEQDRAIAEATAREEERLRLKEENERLHREAAEAARLAEEDRKRVAAEARAVARERDRVAEIERQKAAAEAKAKADEAALVLAEERAAAAEAKAKADAVAKLAQDAVAAQLRAERRAREVAEAEIQAAKKAEADRVAREAEAARRAAVAPEREKLIAFAAALRGLPVPDVAKAEEIREQVEHFAKWVEELIP